MNTAELIYEQVKALPEPLAREVLDFVGYLRAKLGHGHRFGHLSSGSDWL